MTIRLLAPGDVPALADLLRAYIRETYLTDWHGSEDSIRKDGFGDPFSAHVAMADGDPIGFAAWHWSYDLHHCIRGADVLDLYVVPERRGRGTAIRLLCAVADTVQRSGGTYLRGSGPEGGGVRRLYERVATASPGIICAVGGRAFRELAGLSGVSPREALRNLPRREWNEEA